MNIKNGISDFCCHKSVFKCHTLRKLTPQCLQVSDTQNEHDIGLPSLSGAVDRFIFDFCKVVTLNANHEKPKNQNAKSLTCDSTHFNSQCLMLLNFW
jgi:hypothetical protein